MDTVGTGSEANARKRLLIFYDRLPIAADFDDVSRAEFREITERARSDRRRQAQEDGRQILEECYGSIGAPPPPTRVTSTSSPLGPSNSGNSGTGGQGGNVTPTPSRGGLSQSNPSNTGLGNTNAGQDDAGQYRRRRGARGGRGGRGARGGRG